MICVWDDYEFVNDSYISGVENYDEVIEGVWFSRKSGVIQVYFEWLFICFFIFEFGRIWCDFSFGGLIDLFMLDICLEGCDEVVFFVIDFVCFDFDCYLVSDVQM